MPAVDEKRLGELVEDFDRAFLAADGEALAKVVSPAAAWVVRLDTALSGAHADAVGIAALRRQIAMNSPPEPGVRCDKTASTSRRVSGTP
jgi:hypothetical protein